jgi:hypothetical protein
MKLQWRRGCWIAAMAALPALFFGQSTASAQAQGTVPPWQPMTLAASAERGPLPIVLDKGFCARQEKSRANLEQLSANSETGALPPIRRSGVPSVQSEQLSPPKR